MRFASSLDGRAAHRGALRAVIRCWSLLLLTSTGPHRPTTSSPSTAATRSARPLLACGTAGAAQTRWPLARACGQYPRKAAATDAAGIRRRDMPFQQRSRTGHAQLERDEPTRCSSSPRWLSARRVLPHFGHRRTSASAPLRGLPCALRASAPRAGRRLFWAASLAPPTTKQEEQQ